MDKLSQLNDQVCAFSAKVSASKRQLQSLAGSLNFACQVVHGGHTFLRRVIDCVNKLKQTSHRCCLISDIRSNISWWKDFLATFNGRQIRLNFRQSYCIQADASFHGFGAVSPDDRFAGSWAASPADATNSRLYPSHWWFAGHAIEPSLRSNINFLELFSTLISARHWGALWTNW